MEKRRRWILVTGAGTGIGKSSAKFLIEKGFPVFAGVRSESDTAPGRSDSGRDNSQRVESTPMNNNLQH